MNESKIEMTELPNHRAASDEEYNRQRRCETCKHYDPKSFFGDERSAGYCYVLTGGVHRSLRRWVKDTDICDLFDAECS